MPAHLLPNNASPLEIAFSEASDIYSRVDDNVSSMRGIKLVNPPPSYLPYLVYEYGLGELTPYVPNLYDLIREGVAWQRIRGTPAAVSLALSWVGYAANIEEPPLRRKRWNLFQLAMDRTRDNEAELIRIEGVSQLSVPLRSVFWRGFHGYDIRALEYGWTRWGSTLYGSFSGVRLPPGSAKWSFGRRRDVDHLMTEPELRALGVWLDPPEGDTPLTWGEFPWPATAWHSSAALGRSIAMVEAIRPLLGTAWAVFNDAAGSVIGYRRARAMHTVAVASAGIYTVNGNKLILKNEGSSIIYVEAMTDFGDGFASNAASVGFILNADPTDEHPIGSQWLPSGGLQQVGPIVAETNISIEFGRTVRERICAALRF